MAAACKAMYNFVAAGRFFKYPSGRCGCAPAAPLDVPLAAPLTAPGRRPQIDMRLTLRPPGRS